MSSELSMQDAREITTDVIRDHRYVLEGCGCSCGAWDPHKHTFHDVHVADAVLGALREHAIELGRWVSHGSPETFGKLFVPLDGAQ